MEILRTQPYADVSTTYTVPASYTTSTDFAVTITDMADLSILEEEIYTGTNGSVFTFSLPGLYDNSYRVQIVESGDTVPLRDETYDVVRPYVDPETLGTTATEIAAATANEELARAIIDSVIPQGFYYKKKTIETTGLGADYIPLWDDAKKLLKLYENNVLVYDSENAENYTIQFEITKDKTAIVQSTTEERNRLESAALVMPSSQSDLLDLNFGFRGFPKTFDYRIVIEAGYTTIPSDIKKAATLLIDDISCGKMDYYKRYVSAYNTDQFKVQFDKRVFEGTGNVLVDKILSKYEKSITKLGVL
jgi:hypothetical protein